MKIIPKTGLALVIIFFLLCCRKSNLPCQNDHVAIVKKWNIVSDSTFIGVGLNNHPVNYTGQRGDYFDIRTDGFVYMKEGPKLDTFSYTLASDTTILISSFGIILNGAPQMSRITNLTTHSVTIIAPFIVTPGGIFGRKLNLSR